MRQPCTAPPTLNEEGTAGGTWQRPGAGRGWALSNTTEGTLKRFSRCTLRGTSPVFLRDHPLVCCRLGAHSRATPHGSLSQRNAIGEVDIEAAQFGL
jgi:hypothetical protein